MRNHVIKIQDMHFKVCKEIKTLEERRKSHSYLHWIWPLLLDNTHYHSECLCLERCSGDAPVSCVIVVDCGHPTLASETGICLETVFEWVLWHSLLFFNVQMELLRGPAWFPPQLHGLKLITGFSVFISPGSFIFMWKSCMWFLVFF